MDLDAILAPAKQVDGYLRQFLDNRPLPANLRQAMVYALLGGGKRLRPALVLRCCEAVGGSFTQAMAPAAAIEMIHTFSLVHDDLPAMDDDDLRRGRPTLHKHTNEAMAILAGDGMNTLAFELILCDPSIPTPALAAAIVRELAIATNDMVAGQVYDTLPQPPEAPENDGQTLDDLARLKRTHRHKTGALIRASCRMGAMCGNADTTRLESLTRYGEAIGLMFQIVDDVLDVTATTEQLGKTAGKDQKQNKLTYPALLGLDGARAEIERVQAEAVAALKPLGDSGHILARLVEHLAVRRH
ncbi:MAG: polyprenyl synthetase family protein [Phycisphaeraceae bacterium]|nr:polyprenyl synthetase family protein [Phycisphaeraceae bacterium]